DPASTYITIEGALDVPVIRRQSASISVHRNSESLPGAAIALNDTHWQVVISLPSLQFADLTALVVAQRLVRVDLVVEPLRHGKAKIINVGFHTLPVPVDAEK